MVQNKIRLVFLGTPIIACNALKDFINRADIEVLCVVTQPDKPAGRGHKLTPPPVKVLAQENNIEVFQPTSIRKDVDLIEKLKNLNPDFFITIAFGQILSQEVLDIPKFGTINLHASLLPKYRGANPIARAISNGEKETGVCTMLTSLGVDEGDVVLCEKIAISNDMTTLDLAIKISEIAPAILYKSITGLAQNTIIPTPQEHEKATFAPKYTKEEMILDFNNSADSLHNLVRALAPKPAATTYYKGSLLKVIKTKVIEEKTSAQAGTILRKDKNGIYVSTGKNVLLLKVVKPEGKKEMNAYDWSCGVQPSGVLG